ncbi:MAG: FadR family transcriptional regulator [Desulfobacteraceae bacterium]|nr:FadR family transcriptional regulator [Desulfobacteraceae bacterium]
MFKEVRPSKITQKIIAQVRTAILEGKLKPGEKLPPEKDLVDLFQVSKQTLRESLRALEHMGLIDVRKGIGGGPFIVEVDIEVTKESLANYLYFKNLTLDNITEFRKLIEPYAAGRAAETISTADLAHLKELNDSARKNLGENNVPAAKKDEINFHKTIAEQTNNPILILVLDFVESLVVDFKRMFGPDQKFFEDVLDAHDRIYKAIGDRDAKRAAAEMHDHIVAIEENLMKLREDTVITRVYSDSE